MDVRSRGFDPWDLPGLIRSIKGVTPEILYLDCSGAELVRRYDETRRRHPLAPDRPAEDGIARERDVTGPLRRIADVVIDTTDLTPAELREELLRRYGGDIDQPVLTIASFGFARGISRSADLVFDMRSDSAVALPCSPPRDPSNQPISAPSPSATIATMIRLASIGFSKTRNEKRTYRGLGTASSVALGEMRSLAIIQTSGLASASSE